MTRGALYLIPVPLGEIAPDACLAPATLSRLCALDHFIAENAKSARAVLKAAGHPLPLRAIDIRELNEHTPPADLPALLQPLRDGIDVGLVSEAGCPAVADPGSALVALCHRESIPVVPLVGPSSILLALMGSGLNGQHFAFRGYLATKEPARAEAIRELEKGSRRDACVQIFIETPYRNQALFSALLSHCAPHTRLCVASDLTLDSESILCATVAEWMKRGIPSLDRRPTVFLLQA